MVPQGGRYYEVHILFAELDINYKKFLGIWGPYTYSQSMTNWWHEYQVL